MVGEVTGRVGRYRRRRGEQGIKGGLWTLLVVPHPSGFSQAAPKSTVAQLFARLSALSHAFTRFKPFETLQFSNPLSSTSPLHYYQSWQPQGLFPRLCVNLRNPKIPQGPVPPQHAAGLAPKSFRLQLLLAIRRAQLSALTYPPPPTHPL